MIESDLPLTANSQVHFCESLYDRQNERLVGACGLGGSIGDGDSEALN